MYWTSSSGKIELNITKTQAKQGIRQGQCDADIEQLKQVPAIRRQLDKLTQNDVVEEIKRYGAWEDSELTNHVVNLSRLLWLACGDIVEGIS